MRMNIDGLIEPHHAFRAPPKSVYNVMCILRTKAGKNHLPMIRFPITIGVFQKQDIITIGYIDTTVPGKYPCRDMEVIRKHRMLVCHPVSGRVLEYDQLVRLLLPRFNMWIQRTAHYP